MNTVKVAPESREVVVRLLTQLASDLLARSLNKRGLTYKGYLECIEQVNALKRDVMWDKPVPVWGREGESR